VLASNTANATSSDGTANVTRTCTGAPPAADADAAHSMSRTTLRSKASPPTSGRYHSTKNRSFLGMAVLIAPP